MIELVVGVAASITASLILKSGPFRAIFLSRVRTCATPSL